MVELRLLKLFGRRRYYGGRKFAVSKVFTVGSVEREYMAEFWPLWYGAAALVTKIRPRLSNLTLQLMRRVEGSLSSLIESRIRWVLIVGLFRTSEIVSAVIVGSTASNTVESTEFGGADTVSVARSIGVDGERTGTGAGGASGREFFP